MKKKLIFILFCFTCISNTYAEHTNVFQGLNDIKPKHMQMDIKNLNQTNINFQNLIKNLKSAQKNISWQGIQNHNPNGIDINVALFNSELSAIDTASLINKLHPVFQKVLTLPNRVVLSGVYKNLHWLADINTYKQGATGYVSSLSSANINLD